MIVGISGKIGSGKDTIAKMIRYYSYRERGHIVTTLEDWLQLEELQLATDPAYNKWQVKKFGGTLKDVVCLLTGCPREALEDESFKNKVIGEEWRYYTFTDLNTQEKFIYSTHKDAYIRKYRWLNPTSDIEEVDYTYRSLLQVLGTEAGRETIHPNIWVNSLMSKRTPTSNWLITDVRFENEAQAILDRGGVLLRVNRPDKKSSKDVANHSSETALDDYEFENVIVNDGSLKDLYSKVIGFILKEELT